MENQYLSGCPMAATEATTAAVLAIVLLLLILAIAVLIWKKRRAIMRTMVDGVYIQFSTPTHQESVFLGEVTIPVDHLFLEGTVLLRDAIVNQLCFTCTLTVHWRAQLKGATVRPGMYPMTIPLPETIEVSKRLAGIMLGAGKNDTLVRLLKYTSGLATPIPSNLPRLIDSGWSPVGAEPCVIKETNEVVRRNSAPPINILSVKKEPSTPTDIVLPTNSELIRRDPLPPINNVSSEPSSSSTSDISIRIEPNQSVCALKESIEQPSCSSPMLSITPVSDIVTTDESLRIRTVTTFRTTDESAARRIRPCTTLQMSRRARR